jgi:hypothetical protein
MIFLYYRASSSKCWCWHKAHSLKANLFYGLHASKQNINKLVRQHFYFLKLNFEFGFYIVCILVAGARAGGMCKIFNL